MVKVLAHKTGPKAGLACQPGDDVTNFRGEPATFSRCYAPHNSSSTGHVYVVIDGVESMAGYYPSVYNLEWLEVE